MSKAAEAAGEVDFEVDDSYQLPDNNQYGGSWGASSEDGRNSSNVNNNEEKSSSSATPLVNGNCSLFVSRFFPFTPFPSFSLSPPSTVSMHDSENYLSVC